MPWEESAGRRKLTATVSALVEEGSRSRQVPVIGVKCLRRELYGWSRAPGFPPVRRLVGFGQYLMTQNKSRRQAMRNQSMSDWVAEGAVF